MSLRKCESVTHSCVRLRARLRSAGSGQSRRGCWGATGVMCSQALGRVSPVRNHRKAHLQSMLGVPVAIGLLGDGRASEAVGSLGCLRFGQGSPSLGWKTLHLSDGMDESTRAALDGAARLSRCKLVPGRQKRLAKVSPRASWLRRGRAQDDDAARHWSPGLCAAAARRRSTRVVPSGQTEMGRPIMTFTVGRGAHGRKTRDGGGSHLFLCHRGGEGSLATSWLGKLGSVSLAGPPPPLAHHAGTPGG